jgi:hypothetical protein
LGSRAFIISSAFLVEIFFKTRSTLSPALAFWKRSMIVVAVKSEGGVSEEDSRDWKISIGRAERGLESRGLTPQSLLIPTQVFESRRPSVQSLDTEIVPITPPH